MPGTGGDHASTNPVFWCPSKATKPDSTYWPAHYSANYKADLWPAGGKFHYWADQKIWLVDGKRYSNWASHNCDYSVTDPVWFRWHARHDYGLNALYCGGNVKYGQSGTFSRFETCQGEPYPDASPDIILFLENSQITPYP